MTLKLKLWVTKPRRSIISFHAGSSGELKGPSKLGTPLPKGELMGGFDNTKSKLESDKVKAKLETPLPGGEGIGGIDETKVKLKRKGRK